MPLSQFLVVCWQFWNSLAYGSIIISSAFIFTWHSSCVSSNVFFVCVCVQISHFVRTLGIVDQGLPNGRLTDPSAKTYFHIWSHSEVLRGWDFLYFFQVNSSTHSPHFGPASILLSMLHTWSCSFYPPCIVQSVSHV